MDREFLTKHNMMEAHKQFMRLSEGYLATSLAEAGEEEENQPQEPGMPADGNRQALGMEGMPPAEGAPMDDQPPMGEQPPTEGQPTDMQPPMEGGDLGDEAELDDTVDDEVLDVEDLTQAQEKLNKKQNSLGHDLGEVDDRILALLTAVEKIQGSLDKNNNDITALKAELEKRVPTDKEKLNMQSLKMYPFNVSPNDYWKDKEKDGRYEAEEKPEEKEYKITRGDVDEYNEGNIEKSLDDSELHQTMKDIFKGF